MHILHILTKLYTYCNIRVNIMKNKTKFRPDPEAKLMDQVKEVLRYHHYAYRTEITYSQWILRYIHHYGGKTHPREMGKQQVEAFLSNLVTQGNVASSTQRQALNALVFLYREVLDMPIEGEMMPIRSKKKIHPPTVLTQEEVQTMFLKINGTHLLMAKILYGAGLRLMECIRLRIQDVDFGQNKIYVRGGKGGKDRMSMLPQNIRVLQTLMGHADVKTTEIYTHVMKKDIDAIQSPLDQW